MWLGSMEIGTDEPWLFPYVQVWAYSHRGSKISPLQPNLGGRRPCPTNVQYGIPLDV